MPLKKQPSNANEIAIYDEALIYQRGEYWQMRMWLAKEKKYARFSLRTRNNNWYAALPHDGLQGEHWQGHWHWH